MVSKIFDLTGNVVKADGFASSATQSVTLTGNAGTITQYNAICTTPSLATAAGAAQAETITLASVTASNMAFVQLAGGTNTTWAGVTARAVCTANTVTVTIHNGNAAALNGTIIFNLTVE